MTRTARQNRTAVLERTARHEYFRQQKAAIAPSGSGSPGFLLLEILKFAACHPNSTGTGKARRAILPGRTFPHDLLPGTPAGRA
ncbi:hypothetical protein [Celeribacter indicus]|uniref:hypothetical protein n=1 Tax=Celeribacter indicus TaxID=1208324 RepID=UPI00089BDF0D|nr:hypothetical protein [Celeribacter indicus]SDW84689.1 hypothetical protein SAMN05443573_10841 [Celeribacter indicus]